MNVFNLYEHVSEKTLKKISDYILENKIYISTSYPVFDYDDELWVSNPIDNRSYTLKMQALTPISYLIAYYKKTNNESCIEKALQLFYLWYEHNHLNSFLEVIPERTLVISELYTTCIDNDFCVLDDLFDEVLTDHCKYLAKHIKSNYMNHIALFIASNVKANYFNDHSYKEYKTQVKKYMKLHLNELIYEDGSFKEHDIELAYRLYIRLNLFVSYLDEVEKSRGFKRYLKEKLNKLLLYLYVLLEPSGYLPPIGESGYFKLNYEIIKHYHKPYKDYFEYLFSNGKTGKELLYLNVFFQKSNIFVSINRNVINESFTKLIFYCPNHRVKYDHYDDLSFLFYYQNTLLFIDGGKYNFEYDNFYRNAVTSIYAHNTICVDHHHYILSDKKGITNVSYVDDCILASAISCLYQDVLIKRHLFFIKNNRLFIIDEIIATSAHDYEIIFNINPKVNLKNQGNAYRGYLDDSFVFSLKSLYSTISLNNRRYYGDYVNNKGWFSENINQITPSHCVIYDGKGQNAVFITEIALKNEKNYETEIRVENNQFQIIINEDVFTISSHKSSSSLKINNRHVKNFLNKNNALMKAIKDFYQVSGGNIYETNTK